MLLSRPSTTTGLRPWALLFAVAIGCTRSPDTGAAPAPTASLAPGSPSATSAPCAAAAKKLAECGISAEAAGVGAPCDERVAGCIAGQGCEAIRTKQTGCVFE